MKVTGETGTHYDDSYYAMTCCVCGAQGKPMYAMPYRVQGLFAGQFFACWDDCWHRLKDAEVVIKLKSLPQG